MLVSRAIVQGQQEGTPEERPSQQALLTRAVFVLTWLAVVWASQLFFCCLVALAGSADPPSPSVALKPDVIVFPDRLCVSGPPVATGCDPPRDLPPSFRQ